MKLADVFLTAALAAGSLDAAAATRAQYVMGTVCEITASTAADVERGFAESRRVENLLTTWREDSELAAVNRGSRPGAELHALLTQAAGWRKATNGAFDPCMRPLIDAWQTRGSGSVPGHALRLEAMQKVTRCDAYEEGGFGKGYALDRTLAVIEGPAVLNFGGQVAVRGELAVNIADPQHRHHPVLSLRIHDQSLSTSSGSEKTFVSGGTRYTHLIDPRSGMALPPRGSVSVIHRSAFIADILSTTLYVMGVREGLDWARAHGITAIFIDENGVIRTAGAIDALSITDPKFTTGD